MWFVSSWNYISVDWQNLIFSEYFQSFLLEEFNFIFSYRPGQQDPMQESREVYDGIISVLERGSEVSVRILEQLLTSGEVKC